MAGEAVTMSNDDRRLIVETLSEMKEFKKHVIGRVEQLEKKEGERGKERISIFSILISGLALAVSIVVNFFKQGGK